MPSLKFLFLSCLFVFINNVVDVLCFQPPSVTSSFKAAHFSKTLLTTRTARSSLLQSSVADTTEEPSAAIISGPPAISARDLTCSFDGGGTYQLQSASYILPRGARVGLVGRNGCGKSTFLRILAESCGYGSDGSNAKATVLLKIILDHCQITQNV